MRWRARILRVIGHSRIYFDPTGLAAAKIEVRALRVVIIPAFAMDTVCCSYTSCQLLLIKLRFEHIP